MPDGAARIFVLSLLWFASLFPIATSTTCKCWSPPVSATAPLSTTTTKTTTIYNFGLSDPWDGISEPDVLVLKLGGIPTGDDTCHTMPSTITLPIPPLPTTTVTTSSTTSTTSTSTSIIATTTTGTTTSTSTCVCTTTTSSTSTTATSTTSSSTSTSITSTTSTSTITGTTTTATTTTATTTTTTVKPCKDDAVEIAAIIDLTPIFDVNLGTDEDLFVKSLTEDQEMNQRLRQGYELYAQWINGVRGGIRVEGKWKPLSLTLYDNHESGKQGSDSIAKYLIEQRRYNFILGPYSVEASRTLSKIADNSTRVDQFGRPDKPVIMLPGPAPKDVFKNKSRVFGVLPDPKARLLPLFSTLNGSRSSSWQSMTQTGTGWSIAYIYGKKELGKKQTLPYDDSSPCAAIPEYANLTSPKMTFRGAYNVQTDESEDYKLSLSTQGSNLSAWLEEVKHPDIIVICVPGHVCMEIINHLDLINYNPGEMRKGGGAIVMEDCLPYMPEDTLPTQMFSTPWVPEASHISGHAGSATGDDWSFWTSHTFHHSYLHMFGPSTSKDHSHTMVGGHPEAPLYLGAAAFASLEVLVSSIEAAGSQKPEKVLEHMTKNFSFKTVLGEIIFDEHGQSKGHYKLGQLQSDGTSALVGPESEQMVKPFFPMPRWPERSCYTDVDGFVFGFTEKVVGFLIEKNCTLFYKCPITWQNFSEALRFADDVVGADTSANTASYYKQKAKETWEDYIAPHIIYESLGEYKTLAANKSGKWKELGAQGIFEKLIDTYVHQLYSAYDEYVMGLVAVTMLQHLRTSRGQRLCAPCPSGQVSVYDKKTKQAECQSCSEQGVNLLARDITDECRRSHFYDMKICKRKCIAVCEKGEGLSAADDGTCRPCPVGTQSIDARCVNCTGGHYNDKEKQTLCPPCARGKYQPSPGMSSCMECEKGYEAQTVALKNCSSCSRGTYAAEVKTSACLLCQSGSIASERGLTTCEECTRGKYSAWNASVCLDCPEQTYQNRNKRSSCLPAVPGASFAGTGLVRGNNSARYWTRDDGDHLDWEFCKRVPTSCLQGEKCTKGSTGIHCGSCVPGYFPPNFPEDKSCEACPHFVVNATAAILYTVLIFLLSIGMARLAVSSQKRSGELHLAILKILIHFGVCAGCFGMILRKSIEEKRLLIGEDAAELGILISWIYTEGLMGKLYHESGIFSLYCLLSPRNAELAANLENMKHSHWFKTDLITASYVKDLIAANKEGEESLLYFWMLFPILFSVFVYITSLIILLIFFLKKSSSYNEANQFYIDLKNEGASYVNANYDESTLQPYFDAYKYRLCGIWWPFHYIPAAHKQGCCYRRRTFGGETKPVIFTGLLLCYGAVLIGVMRPWHCMSFSEAHSKEQFMVSTTSLGCNGEDHSRTLVYYSNVGVVAWGVLFPLFTFYAVAWKQRKLLAEDWWKAENSILISGYRGKCAWFESVVFFDKFLLVYLTHSGDDVDRVVLLQMLLALFYGAVCVGFMPCDKRSNNVLWRVSSASIGIRLMACIVLEVSLIVEHPLAWTGTLLVGLALNILFIMFAFRALFHHGLSTVVLSASGQDELGWLTVAGQQRKPRYFSLRKRLGKRLHIWAHGYLKKQQVFQPYVCFDHLLGWLTIIGNRGDLKIPTKIERGHRSQNRTGRPDLSNAPTVPTIGGEDEEFHIPIKPAHIHQHHYIEMIISETLMSMVTGLRHSSTFSVSIMEFIIRLGFLMAHKSAQHFLETHPNGRSHKDSSSGSDDLPEHLIELAQGESLETTAGGVLSGEEAHKFVHNLSDGAVQKLTDMHTSGRVKKGTHMHSTLSTQTARLGISQGSTAMQSFEKHNDLQEVLSDTELTLELLLDEIRHRPERGKKNEEPGAGLRVSQLQSMEHSGAGSGLGYKAVRHISKATGKLKAQVGANEMNINFDDEEDAEMKMQHYKSEYDLGRAKQAQLMNWVKLMFNPNLYSQGVRIDQLQQGMMRVSMMKRGEVKFLLDRFEEQWLLHNSFKAVVLKRYANMMKDMPLQVDLEEPKPEVSVQSLEETVYADLQAEQQPRHQADHDRKTEANRQRHERVAYRWARMAMTRGNALSTFRSTELIGCCKANMDRKHKDLKDKLAQAEEALNKKKNELADLLPALPDDADIMNTVAASGESIAASAENTAASAENPAASAENTAANAENPAASAENTAANAENPAASEGHTGEATEAPAHGSTAAPEGSTAALAASVNELERTLG